MNKEDYILIEQAKKLKEFIDNFIKCCEGKRFYESKKLKLPYVEAKTMLLLKGQRYLTINHIANQLNVAMSRASKIVKDLVKKGFADIISDPKDKRIKLISLTADGKKKVEKIEEFHIQIHKRLLEDLSPSERIMLLSFLERLKINMESIKRELLEEDTNLKED